MLTECPECSGKVSDAAISCPHCGYPMKSLPVTAPLPRAKKRRRKLPNGFGSIKKLSGKRSKPYAAYPATTEFNQDGVPVPVPAIGYFADYNSAYIALAEYNRNPYDIETASLTFSEVYEMFYKHKFIDNQKRVYSASTLSSTAAAFKNCRALHDLPFSSLKTADLQKVLDKCPLKHSSLELIVNLYKQMYKYALAHDFVDKDYASFVVINKQDDDVRGIPFSYDDIALLWENLDLPYVDTILIYIYSGFRISEFRDIEINLDKRYFKGGVKTAAGKNRIVPIHEKIYPLVAKYSGDTFLKTNSGTYRKYFKGALDALGLLYTPDGILHTPHDCRHTFSWLCDEFEIDNLSKHLMMGHAITGDVESAVYGHRTLERLAMEINKIKV